MFCQPQRWWGFQCGGLGALQRCCGFQDADPGLSQRRCEFQTSPLGAAQASAASDGAAVHIQRRYSNAPPDAGRGVTTSNNQTFCKAPCMANMRITMIVLLRAWNSHEYAMFFPDFTYTSVRMMLNGR